jgi:hypothetical protein
LWGTRILHIKWFLDDAPGISSRQSINGTDDFANELHTVGCLFGYREWNKNDNAILSLFANLKNRIVLDVFNSNWGRCVDTQFPKGFLPTPKSSLEWKGWFDEDARAF